jgi:drug/metabolite transporter (DMT)-like permease
MNATLIATIAGLITALCWGFTDWLTAKSAKKLSVVQVNLTIQAIDSLAALLVFLLFSGFHMPTAQQALAVGAGGILITIAYLLFVKALATSPVGVIAPLGNSYPLITILLSIFVLSETFSAGQVGAMIGIIIGASLLAYQKNRQKIPARELHKDTLLAAAAAVTWGLAFFIQDTVVKDLNWQTIFVTMEAVTTILSSLIFIVAYRTRTIAAARQAITYKPALFAGLMGALGFIAFYLGSDRAGSLIIPTVLSACGTLVASVLGAVFDKEKIGALKRVGAVLVVAGIIVLNVS